MFHEGLKWDVRCNMVGKTPDTLAELKALAIQLDEECMGAYCHNNRSTTNHTPTTNPNEPACHTTTSVKAKVARIGMGLSADNCAWYLCEGHCFGCGKTGHRCPNCPNRKPHAHVTAIKPVLPKPVMTSEQSKNLDVQWSLSADKRIWNRACLTNVVPQNTVIVSAITLYQLVRLLTTPITLVDSIKMTAMVDSGAMGNFIHLRFIEFTKTHEPLVVNDVNGHLLLRVDQQAEIRMTIRGHSKMLMFDIALLGKHNIVLGLPWLQQHDPIVHWSSRKLTFASNYCEQQCLAVPASTFLNQWPIMPVMPLDDLDMELLLIEGAGLSTIDIPEHLMELTEMIPEVYWDRMGVFNGQKVATTLPELQGPDVDFAIELDPTKPLPKPSHPYHMNQEEWAECRKVLDKMLSAGWVEPADVKCLMAAPMFFIWKKDGAHQPVIDY
jgi:hypothetical protein